MLFKALKSLLMILPQSTCYVVLKDRLTSVSRFRQSAIQGGMMMYSNKAMLASTNRPSSCVSNSSVNGTGGGTAVVDAEAFLKRVLQVRDLHCTAAWNAIRADSLEVPNTGEEEKVEGEEHGTDRRRWLGYASMKEEQEAQEKFHNNKQRQKGVSIEEVQNGYQDLPALPNNDDVVASSTISEPSNNEDTANWKQYWAAANE